MVHEHDHECGCGHHHHDEDTEHLHTNKYQQAFAKFEAAGTTEEVTGRVKTLLGKHGNDNFTPDVLKQIHGFIDLTSLTSIDTMSKEPAPTYPTLPPSAPIPCLLRR